MLFETELEREKFASASNKLKLSETLYQEVNETVPTPKLRGDSNKIWWKDKKWP